MPEMETLMLKLQLSKKISILLIAWFLPLTATFANVDIDALFRQLDLVKLIGTDTVLNLMAQTKSAPEKGTSQPSDFDDFYVLDSVDNKTKLTEFNAKQEVLTTYTRNAPWVGVASFQPNELENLISLQDGFQNLKNFMEPKLDTISKVIIYKSLRSQQIIYDYVFKDPAFDSKTCREWLYIPSTDQCEPGMVVSCQIDPLEKRNIKK